MVTPATSASAPHVGDAPAFLSSEAVMALSGLFVRARTVADGVLAGMHQSQRHGRSVEFAEHKVYTPGDDVRHLDWKAYARFDRYYIRRFLEETSLRAFLVADVSGSMAYAGGAPGSRPGIGKADYARVLCGTLACLLVRQADTVGCMTFADTAGPKTAIRGGERQLHEVLDNLASARVGGPTHPAESLAALASHVSRRALVVVATDLLDTGLEILEPLAALRNRGADVAVFHVIHPDEEHFPYDGLIRFLDLEGERETQVDAAAVRTAYLEEFGAWLTDVENRAHDRGLDYLRVGTDEPPARALLRFLEPRRHLG
ncbi:MAG: DUF58 domain-containing protein [Deltaproteobacteria bacterium]|nr:DUF58 domain-containing protein [Deltaproteobacteria bacterium]